MYHFNSHTPREVWLYFSTYLARLCHFNSHTPREVWPGGSITVGQSMHFNSHTPREVWHAGLLDDFQQLLISTHTPLARCGKRPTQIQLICHHFNSHTPREVWRNEGWDIEDGVDFNSHTPREVWHGYYVIFGTCRKFQLTHPSRGVALLALLRAVVTSFQLTHPSRGVTPAVVVHAERPQFQLTHPSRGVTTANFIININCKISTHTPLARCDQADSGRHQQDPDFNSHTPREV